MFYLHVYLCTKYIPVTHEGPENNAITPLGYRQLWVATWVLGG